MATSKKYDVMISYEHSTGKEYKDKLVPILKEAGFKVWVDNEQMHGDTYECMADGVCFSRVMILLLSKKYAESENCKKEYEHTCKTKTNIIPVYLDQYRPPLDSALGIILGARFYYKVYGEFDDTDDIINAVRKYTEEQNVEYGPNNSKAPNQDEKSNDESLPSKKYDIVISYELQSGKKCKDKLVQKLRDAGFFLWVDSDEEYGEFPERMADRIAGARVIMLLLSTHYAGSKTCDKQFQQALQTNKKIIPVKVEKFDPAEDSSLGKLMSDEVSYKLYKKFDANVKKIINALNQYLDKTDCNEEDGKDRKKSFNSHDNKSDFQEIDQRPSVHPMSINILGGNVVIGDFAKLVVSRDSPQQYHETNKQRTEVTKPKQKINKTNPLVGQETSLPQYCNLLNSSEYVEVTPLSPEAAYEQGLERSVGDFDEDFLEELAVKLGNESTVIANWEKVAHVLQVDVDLIMKMKDKGTAHRLLIKRLRDEKPNWTINHIRNILENKMKRNPRRDIFFDYVKKPGLPQLHKELGNLNESEFELVLENVADKLIAEPVRGHWRHLGGHIPLTPFDLDQIESAGKSDTSRSSSRTFIDHLGSRGVKVRSVIDALKAETVQRIDVLQFVEARLKTDDCWMESCASLQSNAYKKN